MSANRASSKARSASVTGRSSGESVSQTLPINSSLSAGLRLETLDRSDSSIMVKRITLRVCSEQSDSPRSGRLIIAQPFKAGYRANMQSKPALASDRFSRPFHGLHSFFDSNPSDESLGYFRSS